MAGTQIDGAAQAAVAFEALGKLAAMPEMPAATKAALAEVEVQVAAALVEITEQRTAIERRDNALACLEIEFVHPTDPRFETLRAYLRERGRAAPEPRQP